MNLLEETIERLKPKTPLDVSWVGSETWGYFTWSEFAVLANRDYDDGFGAAEVAVDLLVVGDGFWLEREEYDGSEGWAYKSQPIQPRDHKVPRRVIGGMWLDLAELDAEEIE